jgi:hypothetical protein
MAMKKLSNDKFMEKEVKKNKKVVKKYGMDSMRMNGKEIKKAQSKKKTKGVDFD